jgi:GntR family transcriptional regulator
VQTTSDVVREMGIVAEVRILRFGPVMAPLAIAKTLGQSHTEPLLGIDKLYADQESSIALVRCFLPLDVQAEMDLIRLQPSVTTLGIWERKLGMKVKGAKYHIRSEPAGGEVAAALALAPGTPLLVLERTTYAEDGRALEFVASMYNWRRYAFSIALPRVRMDELGYPLR